MFGKTMRGMARGSLTLCLAFGIMMLGYRPAQAATPRVAETADSDAVKRYETLKQLDLQQVVEASQGAPLDTDTLAELADRQLDAEELEDFEGGNSIVITSSAVLVAAAIVLLVLLLR